MNIPNILTIVRFLLIPAFGYYLNKEEYIIAIILFSLGGLTDILDGYIARKCNLITSFGKLADPLADKAMQLTALILLYLKGLIPVEFVIIIIAKEIFMVLGSITLYKKESVVVSANWYGKLATVIFYFVIVSVILLRILNFANNKLIIDISTGIAVIFALFAFVMYTLQYRKIRKEPG